MNCGCHHRRSQGSVNNRSPRIDPLMSYSCLHMSLSVHCNDGSRSIAGAGFKFLCAAHSLRLLTHVSLETINYFSFRSLTVRFIYIQFLKLQIVIKIYLVSHTIGQWQASFDDSCPFGRDGPYDV